MKRFALIGAAGFVAERHIRAIKETGNELVCAMDTFDVMGRMDSYFPEAEFVTSEEELVEFLQSAKEKGESVDYISICSPNYLHIKHIELALKNGCDVICEKPLVIDSEDLDKIKEWEAESRKKVNTVLQLRYHPTILKLKNEIEQSDKDFFDIDLKYITSRGKWYFKSWKGDVTKSGGIATNIGIHFFDMLTWIFGEVQQNNVSVYEATKSSGELILEKAKVNWFLSLDSNDLPEVATKAGKRTFRSIKVDGKEIEFSDGFTDLHTVTYQQILAGNGFGVVDAGESIRLTELRNFNPLAH
ncbi:Gfo/Idh/MocA family oxidoreductase [Draconibacterium sp. IB214405]|uniref:Gfo/Idh/MocA family protein n=1 Tax=Draconibacterium sp. IB214405 TaxID=3097352 RepID=UPI002A0F7865|nr:Gfo/Idh/MocA family oxidoreductase [Draconibacterium sp. IB214405]MDX8338066.1 Gfo/Idh/MocA family oxidoreductase [Draconibacterium sp. IB214405]